MELVHVPYRGGGPALQDLLGGQVDLMVGNLSTVLPQLRAGKLRVYALSTAVRSAVAPDVPTLGDQGFPQIDMSAWFGLIAPAGVPDAIVARRILLQLVEVFLCGVDRGADETLRDAVGDPLLSREDDCSLSGTESCPERGDRCS